MKIDAQAMVEQLKDMIAQQAIEIAGLRATIAKMQTDETKGDGHENQD